MNTQQIAFETLMDISATISILIKFGRDDILDTRAEFIAFLNELGFKHNNRALSSTALSNMALDITTTQKKILIEEFLVGHEPLYRKLAMHLNVSRL